MKVLLRLKRRKQKLYEILQVEIKDSVRSVHVALRVHASVSWTYRTPIIITVVI